MKASTSSSAAYRYQITSKQGNKNFYKGTGAHPGLGPKQQGKHFGRKYKLLENKMRIFIVPQGPFDPHLRPYVSKMTQMSNERLQEWPISTTVTPQMREYFPERIFGINQFDGHYFLNLTKFLNDPTNERNLNDNHLTATAEDPKLEYGIVGKVQQIELPSERQAVTESVSTPENYFEEPLEPVGKRSESVFESSNEPPKNPQDWITKDDLKSQNSTTPGSKD